MNRSSRRARRKRGGILRLLSLAIITAVVLFAVSLFFKVEQVIVKGNTKYYDADIAEISGIEVGERLYSFNKFKSIERIQTSFAYASEVTIRRTLPSTVTITIVESVPAAALQQEGEWWLMDVQTKLLERVDAARAGEYITVQGLRLQEPLETRIAQAAAEDELRLEQLRNLLTALESNGLLARTCRIDVSAPTDVNFCYEDRLTVQLGDCAELDYKMRYFDRILEELSPSSVGTIYFAEDKTAHFVEE